jgi:LPS-assembly protein
LYWRYDAQPQIGFLQKREGILGTAGVKLTQNWQLNGGVRYDLNAQQLIGTQFGVGYIDDCVILALNYIRNYNYSGNATTDQRIMFQLSLRTLGTTAFSSGAL